MQALQHPYLTGARRALAQHEARSSVVEYLIHKANDLSGISQETSHLSDEGEEQLDATSLAGNTGTVPQSCSSRCVCVLFVCAREEEREREREREAHTHTCVAATREMELTTSAPFAAVSSTQPRAAPARAKGVAPRTATSSPPLAASTRC